MNIRQLGGWMLAATAVITVGCKGDDDDDGADNGAIDAAPAADVAETPDAGGTPDAAPFDPPGEASCDEFTTPSGTITMSPGTFSGDIGAALANVDVDPTTCATNNGFAGFTAPGPEQVIKVTGLTPGTTYYARMDAVEDLAVYVVSGCNMGAIPAGQCLSFADQTTSGVEAAAFVAPAGGEIFLVVDSFDDSMAITGATYTLTVNDSGCAADLDCPAATPLCNTAELTCGAGPNACADDDMVAEAASDDGPSGATNLDPAAGNVTTINAGACLTGSAMAPVTDNDWYKFTSVNAGDVTLSLTWADMAADLDVVILDAELNVMSESYWQLPEVSHLTFLPAGTYYVIVNKFSPAGATTVTPYTLTFTRGATAACVNTASCASVFDKQRFRATCEVATGSCKNLAGAGAVAAGGLCDTADDCVATAPFCSPGPYTAGADTRSVCTTTGCAADADCTASLGANGRCSVGLQTNYCHLACTTPNQCRPLLGEMPPMGATWFYGTCPASGACTYL